MNEFGDALFDEQLKNVWVMNLDAELGLDLDLESVTLDSLQTIWLCIAFRLLD